MRVSRALTQPPIDYWGLTGGDTKNEDEPNMHSCVGSGRVFVSADCKSATSEHGRDSMQDRLIAPQIVTKNGAQ